MSPRQSCGAGCLCEVLAALSFVGWFSTLAADPQSGHMTAGAAQRGTIFFVMTIVFAIAGFGLAYRGSKKW
jgi:hypothetical protein